MNTNSFTRIIISCLIGAASCGSAMAQKLASGAVAIDSLHTYVEGNRVDVAFSLNLNNLNSSLNSSSSSLRCLLPTATP